MGLHITGDLTASIVNYEAELVHGFVYIEAVLNFMIVMEKCANYIV